MSMNTAIAGETYDNVLGLSNANLIKYTVAPSFGDYPDRSLFTMFGPVYAPRLYASGLDTLDLGSSGKIAFALDDAQRINLSQSGQDTTYAATDSNNLKFQNLSDTARVKVNSNSTVQAFAESNVTLSTLSNVSIDLDSTLQQITAAASNHVIAAGIQALQVAGSNSNAYTKHENTGVLTTFAGETIQNNTSNYNLGVYTQVTLSHTKSNAYELVQDGRIEIFGLSNQSWGSNVSVVAGTQYSLSNAANTASLLLTDSTIAIATNSNISNSSDKFGVLASTQADLTAGALSNAFLKVNSNGFWTAYAQDTIQHNAPTFNVGVDTTALVSHSNSNAWAKWTDGLLELYGYSNRIFGSNVAVTAGVQYKLSNVANNASLTLSDSSIVLQTASNIDAVTDKFVVGASSFATLEAGASSNAYLTLNSNGTWTGFAANVMQNNTPTFNLGVDSTALVSHSNSNAWVKVTDGMLELFGNTSKSTGSNLYVTADVSYSLSNTANTASLVLADSLVAVATNSNISNITKQFTVGASNATINVGGSSSNAFLALDTTTLSATLFGAADLWTSVASSNAYLHQSSNGISSLYAQSTNELILPNADSNAFVRLATSNVSIFSAVRTELSVTNSNAWIQLDNTSGLTMSTSNNVNIFAGKALTANAESVFVASSNSNAYVDLTAAGEATVKGLSNVYLSVGAGTPTNIMQVNKDGIIVTGNMQISGALDSINVTQTQLSVFDKIIRLADTPGLSNQVDGYNTNHGSGVQVIGLPQGFSTDPARSYEKSILWNYGQTSNAPTNGAVGVGAADWTKESFWEVLGGSLRITCNRDSDTSSSYGLRINDKDELEIIKASKSNGSWSYKRITRFGVATGR